MDRKYWRSTGNEHFDQNRNSTQNGGSRFHRFNFGSKLREVFPQSFNLDSMKTWFRKLLTGKRFWKVLGAAVGLFLLFGVSAFAWYSRDLPDPDRVNSRLVAESTKILDRNGELLYDIFGEAKRTLIEFEDMPQDVKDATVAIEDKDFYRHRGVDFSRIISSAVIDILTLSKEAGASTITQQFIKNALLTNEKLFSRKIKEAVLAIQIERKFSKDEILKLYLNEVPYGNNAYGIEAAAQTYFNKHARDLSLAESAYLAALPQAPTIYSPYGPNRDQLDARKSTVLDQMFVQGYISEEEKNTAMAEEVTFSPVRNSITAPHFVLYVQDLLVQEYGEKTLQEGGLAVTTSLDLNLQRMAEAAVAEWEARNAEQYGANNASLVAIDPNTGEVLAMVGSKDYFNDDIDGQVNVALRPRQPGSSFKPYVYAAAFKEGYSPATMLMDVSTNFGNFGGEAYIPQNYNGQVHGPISMRSALAGSLNIPAVKTIMLVGMRDAIDTATDMGITTLTDPSRYGPSLVLGGGEVKLLDHTSAYGVFATGGIRHEPVTVLKITDSSGDVLEEYKPDEGQRVLDAQVAFLINSVLSDNAARAFTFGASSYLNLPGRPSAAKTGTTQNSRDAWIVGYTPQLVAGVWVGNSDNTAMRAGGSSLAAPIWNNFMKAALAETPAENFTRPAGIRDIAVDKVSGKLPTQYTPETKPEVFASFALPEEYDDVHVQIQGQVYTVLHSEKPEDPAWEDPVRAWAQASGLAYPGMDDGGEGGSPQIIIQQPNSGTVVTELPLTIAASVVARSGNVEKLTIYMDNEEVFSVASDKVSYFFDGNLPDGKHAIKIRAKLENGEELSTSESVIFALGNSAVITSPVVGAVVFFPATIVARADTSIASVEFFIQRGANTPIRLSGTAVKQTNEDMAEFRLNWQGNEEPGSGVYDLYARTNNGDTTNRVEIIIP